MSEPERSMSWEEQLGLTVNGSQTLSKREAAFLRPHYPRYATHGYGCMLYGEGGKAFIDLNGALGSVTIGYGMDRLYDGCREMLLHGPSLSLPSLLEGHAAAVFVDSCSWIDRVRWVKTGSEANEAAIRMARITTGREKIISFQGHYHGWHAQLQAGANYRLGIPAEFFEVFEVYPFPMVQEEFDRCWSGPKISWTAFEARLKQRTIAAIILEPAQWEITPKVVEDLKRLRRICSETDTVLIFDEVLTGFRFSMFGIAEQTGVHPDVSTYGKCLAQGLPLACVAGKAEIMEHSWTTSGTFGGERLSLQVFLNVVKYYRELNVIQELALQGALVKLELLKTIPSIAVEGSGPRLRITFHDDPDQRKRLGFLWSALDSGLFIHPAGINIMASLICGWGQLNSAFARIGKFLEETGGLSDEQLQACKPPEPPWRERSSSS